MKNEYFWQKNNVLLRSLKESDADMLYDALHYVTQIKEIADKHKQSRKYEKKPNSG